MYRPEGWENPYRALSGVVSWEEAATNAYEAGADAMQVWVLAELTYIMRPIHTMLEREKLLNNLLSRLGA